MQENCINCDKIEGTNRTLIALDMDYVEPDDLVACFELDEDIVTIRRSKLDLILKFWNLQKEVYLNKIYIQDVFAAEAMLTRSLEILFNSVEKVNNFILSTDIEVIERAKENGISNEIIQLLLSKNYFIALSITKPHLFQNYKEIMNKFRFDKNKRSLLEEEIAKELNVNPLFLISHFSLRKQFYLDLSLLLQTSMFENNETIPIGRLNKALYTSKVSGDFFEIFYNN